MSKYYWNDENKYKRILEILSDYWLSEENEEYVEVQMYFRHRDGQEQEKRITWRNPNFVWSSEFDFPLIHDLTTIKEYMEREEREDRIAETGMQDIIDKLLVKVCEAANADPYDTERTSKIVREAVEIAIDPEGEEPNLDDLW